LLAVVVVTPTKLVQHPLFALPRHVRPTPMLLKKQLAVTHQPAPSLLPLVLLTADGKLMVELVVQHVLLERVHLLLAPHAQRQLTLDTTLLELQHTLALLLEYSLEATWP
jgi:hypothetical protein